MPYFLDALYLFIFPIVALVRLSRKRRTGIWDRFFGRTYSEIRNPKSEIRNRVWFHGVSVGEIHLLRGIVREFRRRHPEWQCIVSASTDSGFAEAQKWFAELPVIRWPLDFSWAVDRALTEVRPDLVVLAESEFWPNFLLAAKRRNIPVVAVNVRLSPRSFRRYLRFRSLAGRWLRLVSHFAVQTSEYAEQMQSLGVPAQRLSVTGSVKYDGAMMDRDNQRTSAFRELFAISPLARSANAGDERPSLALRANDGGCELVWVAGSTQAPEEEIVVRVFQKLRQELPNLRLILVPRQPDRFDEVAELLRHRDIPFIRRSSLSSLSPSPPASGGEGRGEGGEHTANVRFSPPHPRPLSPEAGERGGIAPCDSAPAVILVDSLGELSAIWGLADIAFVGGSLDGRRGGQNMIEPAAFGSAVIFGPHVWNFADTAERLLQAHAAIQISDAETLEATVRRLLTDQMERTRLGAAACALVRQQQGATARTIDILAPIVAASKNQARHAA